MRRPHGYVGTGHETLGSDVLAVLQCLKFPEHVLGKEEVARLAAVDPAAWYPIDWLLSLMETVDLRIGHYGLMAMGRKLFQQSHADKARGVVRSARDLFLGLDGLYKNVNRGRDIGGWLLTRYETGYAELRKNTPHHCAMEQGILIEALEMVGVRASISQTDCFRAGADHCTYVITSPIRDRRWGPVVDRTLTPSASFSGLAALLGTPPPPPSSGR